MRALAAGAAAAAAGAPALVAERIAANTSLRRTGAASSPKSARATAAWRSPSTLLRSGEGGCEGYDGDREKRRRRRNDASLFSAR